MKKKFLATLMLLAFAHYANAQTGTDLVKRYFGLDRSIAVDEYVVKSAILNISPKCTKFEDVVKKLENIGIYYHPKDNSPIICFPADDTPLYCQFRSSKEFRGLEPDYSVEFVFDEENKVKDVIVVRSYAGKVKRHTTNPTQAAKDLVLRSNLSVGSKIKDFDSAYGEGLIEETPDVADDWPLSLLYFDNKINRYFYVGVEIGNMSWSELKLLKNDRRQLGGYKAGIIYVVNGK